MIATLVSRGYKSDPVKAWKDEHEGERAEDGDDASSVASSTSSNAGPDFNYLLSMPLWSLTQEKKEELIKQRDDKVGFNYYMWYGYCKVGQGMLQSNYCCLQVFENCLKLSGTDELAKGA